MQIDIIKASPLWSDNINWEAKCQNIVTATCTKLSHLYSNYDLNQSELSIILSNDEEIQELNKNWRYIDKPTNVLSFPTKDLIIGETPNVLLGDVILSYKTIQRECEKQNKLFENHFSHLLIHGILHLLGFDHQTDDEAVIMENMEKEILQTLNISNPYELSNVI